ncbi:hypothetical protein LOAG_02254 [Loa loa]|uniref:Uncharacterized protein n=1 Tax=Loa loa TaxID=7209 RepID=A0A1S0U7L2_LOALO|nr:hypothetical protein LOAG_02254 [Loa loa]EFO26228.1 hypothetical protein LOAG_02254 [Loa loa]
MKKAKEFSRRNENREGNRVRRRMDLLEMLRCAMNEERQKFLTSFRKKKGKKDEEEKEALPACFVNSFKTSFANVVLMIVLIASTLFVGRIASFFDKIVLLELLNE